MKNGWFNYNLSQLVPTFLLVADRSKIYAH